MIFPEASRPPSWRSDDTALGKEFRAVISDETVAGPEVHEVEAGAFKESGTNIATCIMVLDKGRTQQVAAPTEAYLRPANRFVAEFLGIAQILVYAGGIVVLFLFVVMMVELTKALVEANRAAFSIKSARNAGTLVEITFPPTRVLAS